MFLRAIAWLIRFSYSLTRNVSLAYKIQEKNCGQLSRYQFLALAVDSFFTRTLSNPLFQKGARNPWPTAHEQKQPDIHATRLVT